MKKIFNIFLLLFALFLLQLSIRLYYKPIFKQTAQGFSNQDVKAQLAFLKTALENGVGEEMQQIYPEGLVFTYALYGLAWCNYLKQVGTDTSLLAVGRAEISLALNILQSERAKSIFTKDLLLEYGAFYNGWSTYLLAQKLSVLPPNLRTPSEEQFFHHQCRKIVNAFSRSSSAWLSSYQEGLWPADNVLCIAALAQHDKLYTPEFEDFIQKWLKKVNAHVDPATGLIPHRVFPNGTCAEGARGSSQSLMLTFLPEIDKTFAAQQFDLYEKQFVMRIMGLPGVREYPKGKAASGDIDSGPVVFGMGGAACIAGIAACRINQKTALSVQMRNTIEGLGCPTYVSNKKRYFGGLVPMADAFLAWAHSFQSRPDKPEAIAFQGRNVFHSYCFLMMSILSVGWWWPRLRRKQ